MKKKHWIMSLAIMFCLVFCFLGTSWSAYDMSIKTCDNTGTEKKNFSVNEDVYLHIGVSDLQNIAGCAFTAVYPNDVLLPPVVNAEGLSTDVTSTFDFSFTKDGTTTQTNRQGTTSSGKVYFSGAAIDMTSGGGKYPNPTPGASFPLFIAKFKVKPDAAPGTYYLNLIQTELHNPAAGYGTEGDPQSTAPVPILVGAVPKTDTANWDNLTGGAFPVLLSGFAVPVTPAEITITGTNNINGTVGYNGAATGNLVAAAYLTSDTNFVTPYGQQIQSWPSGTTTKAVNLAGIPNGTYYVRAFIDKNMNGVWDVGEPWAKYPTSVTITNNSYTLPTNLVPEDYYAVTGTITYNGSKTGTLYVGAFDKTDTSFTTPLAMSTYVWDTGKTTQEYAVYVKNGEYLIAAYIGTATQQSTDPKGSYPGVVAVTGANVSGKSFALAASNGWSAVITSTGQTVGSAVKISTVTIGEDSEAITHPAPPTPVEYTTYTYLTEVTRTQKYFDDIRVKNDLGNKWVIAVDPHGNVGDEETAVTATLSWDPSQFSATGYFILRKGYDGLGEIVVADMRTTTQYAVTGLASPKQYFTIEQTYKIPATITLTAGWNLVSLPVTPDDCKVSTLFPDAEAAFKFNSATGYSLETVLTPGVGYWIKVPQAKSYTISGQNFTSSVNDITTAGWYLMGSVNGTVTPTAVPTDAVEAIFGFSGASGYNLTSTMAAGSGYWVKFKNAARFTLQAN